MDSALNNIKRVDMPLNQETRNKEMYEIRWDKTEPYIVHFCLSKCRFFLFFEYIFLLFLLVHFLFILKSIPAMTNKKALYLQ